MKHIKIKLLFVLFALSPTVLSAQNALNINAAVLSSDGFPLAGALVRDNADNISTTDETGWFSMETSSDILTVTAVGYEAKEVAVTPDLKEVYLQKEKLVNVALRQVKEEDLMGRVEYVNIPELLEKNYHTYSLDNLQAYVSGYNGSIWGHGSLQMIVDGVPRDASNVMPTEIEQISVLKGSAAVALYGTKATNGALIITTKRGVNKGNQINVRLNTGLHAPKSYPNYVGSAEYMELYNEAVANDNGTPGVRYGLYSEDAIVNAAAGTNPYRYPDVDYYSSDYLRKVYNKSDLVTEFVGGNDRARFYTNIGIAHNNSLLKVGEGNNDRTTRLNIRGNLDVKLNKFITSRINATMVFYDIKGAQGNYWGNAASLRPNRYTPLIPIASLKGRDDDEQEILNNIVANSDFLIDGKYLLGGNLNHLTNPFADMYAKGSSTYSSRNFQFDAAVDFDLSSALKGLSFSTQFGIDYLSSFNLSVNNNTYATYDATWWTDSDGNEYICTLNANGTEDKASKTRNLSDSYLRQNTFFTANFAYNNTFGFGHNVSAILVARGNQEAISSMYHKWSSANLGLQAGYNYNHKYYAEFAGNVVHSAKLAPGHRQAFSPTLSLAWRISREDFLADSDLVNDLRLSASAGILNTDQNFSGYYDYMEIYTNNGWYTWQEGLGRDGTIISNGGNSNLTFAKRKEFNLGLDAAFFKNALRLNASYFYSAISGMPIHDPTRYPSYFATNGTEKRPYDNSNADLRTGFDFGISFNKRIGQVDLSIGANALYYNTEALVRKETYEFDNQRRQGRPTDGIWGYVTDGFYESEMDVEQYSSQYIIGALGEVGVGDLKYVDINGDGAIDTKDTQYLGRWSAPFSFGMNLTLKWKNFTLFALANGNFGGYGVKNSSYYWVSDAGKYSETVRGRCILETGDDGIIRVSNLDTATYPRLTAQNTGNNFRDSDFWLYKTDRINLSRVQLTYDIPKHVFDNSFVSAMGVYVSGSDLLVISKERKHMEMNIGGSPQTRFYNIGLKVTF